MRDAGSFSIRVVDDDGQPVSGAKVSYQCGDMSGVGTEYTDDDGWATFDIIEAVICGPGPAVRRIWVNSVEVSDESWYPADGDTMSFTIPSE